MTHETWADIISAKLALADAMHSGAVLVTGEPNEITHALGCLDHSSFELVS